MPNKQKVNQIMEQNKCSRTKANNMLRKRGNGLKDKDGIKITKRRSIPKV